MAYPIGIGRDIKAWIEIFERFKHGEKKAGIKHFYDKRSSLSGEWWEKFYTKRKPPKEVIIMGQSLSKTFSNRAQTEAFINWCNSNTKMRILLLSPDSPEVTQIQAVSKEISYNNLDDPNQILKQKILDTIDTLYEKVIAKINNLSLRPMLRVSTTNMPFSLISIDDDMIVTLYGLNPEADEQPTFIIKGKQRSSYLSFLNEFEQLWKHNSKIALFEDPILKSYRKDWKTYIDLYDFERRPKPPRQAIIFPTYNCKQNCSYCMYKPLRTNASSENSKDKNEEIEIDILNKLIHNLISFGVKRIELSGGGEPLEHSNFKQILKIIEDVRSTNNGIKFGLLTNGLNLHQYCPERTLGAFNDYIRVSRCQEVNHSSLQDQNDTFILWKKNIKTLLSTKRASLDYDTKIGIKYLLTNSNCKKFVEYIRNDLKDNELQELDHFRFRSTRDTELKSLDKIEQEVFYTLEESKLITNHPERVSLSIAKIPYHKNFKCWISPMNVVIDPKGDVYICCNYINDKNSKGIGNIKKDDFQTIWHSEKHKRKRKSIRKENCDQDSYCNCRFAELQKQFDILAPFIKN